MPTREETPNALHFFLTKRGHLAMCLRDIPESDGNCFCGYDAAQAELALLRKKAEMAEEIAAIIRDCRPGNAEARREWLTRWSEITKEEQDG